MLRRVGRLRYGYRVIDRESFGSTESIQMSVRTLAKRDKRERDREFLPSLSFGQNSLNHQFFFFPLLLFFDSFTRFCRLGRLKQGENVGGNRDGR